MEDYDPTLSFLDESTISSERFRSINKNYINLIREITNQLQSGEDLDEDALFRHMSFQIYTARRIVENEIMNDPELINSDGSWKEEIINNIREIKEYIDNEEYNTILNKDIPENERNRLLSEYQVNKEVEEQNIQRQIDRWGKPLYLLTKKEMDIIFENSIRNNGNTFALNQIKGN
tara:strand:- start:242 stop:769 length:528 start_codon:yes stop_codon:yes gene_type:complete